MKGKEVVVYGRKEVVVIEGRAVALHNGSSNSGAVIKYNNGSAENFDRKGLLRDVLTVLAAFPLGYLLFIFFASEILFFMDSLFFGCPLR